LPQPKFSWSWVVLAAALLAWAALRDWGGETRVDLATYDFEVNDRGRLLLLQRAGSSDIYLFGTVSSSDPRVLQLADSVQAILQEADLFATESRAVPFDAETQRPSATGESLGADPEDLRALCLLRSGQSLRAIVGASLFEAVWRLLDRSGGESDKLSVDQLDRIHPYCLASWLATPPSEQERQARDENTLDNLLLATALRERKTVVRLESFAEKYDFALSMPKPFLVESLSLAVAALEAGTLDSRRAEELRAYLAGDIDVRPALADYSPDYQAYLLNEALVARSRRIAAKVLELAEDRSPLVAVDATLLPGQEGLVSLLQRAGYGVTVLEPLP